MIVPFVLALYIFSITIQALPAVEKRASKPTQPSKDPFYEPPEGYEYVSPGIILRHRHVPHAVAGILNQSIRLAAQYQILYRSTDNLGNPTATVTTVLIPKKANKSKLLSYQIPEDSPSIDCAPSYILQQNADNESLLGDTVTRVHLLYILSFLEKGWIVSIPDFEGPRGAFLANRRAGYAVLDGIRAVQASTYFTNVSSTANVTMWGYSGGSLATGFAAELQPSYAPELHISGAALGGVIGNIQTVTNTVNGGPFAGLNVLGTHGFANEYPEVEKLLYEQLVDDPARRKKYLDAGKHCFFKDITDFAFEDALSYFKDPDFQNQPALQRAYMENTLGQHIPQMPIFFYKGTLDEVSPVNETNALAEKYCAGGTVVEYHEISTHGHVLLGIDGFLEASVWLQDRMNGVPAGSECTHTVELLPLSDPPRDIDVLGSTVVSELSDVLGL